MEVVRFYLDCIKNAYEASSNENLRDISDSEIVNGLASLVSRCPKAQVRTLEEYGIEDKEDFYKLKKLFSLKTSECDFFSTRIHGLFKKYQLLTIADLTGKYKELSKYKGFGKKSRKEVKEKLELFGIDADKNWSLLLNILK